MKQVTKESGCKTRSEDDEVDMKREDDEGDVGCGRRKGTRTNEGENIEFLGFKLQTLNAA